MAPVTSVSYSPLRFSWSHAPMHSAGPGRVSHLQAETTSFSIIIISWSTPQVPNGIIIAYEITYSVNGSSLVTVNATGTTTLTLELAPSTTVSGISVRAYTRIGPGPAVTTGDVSTLCELFGSWCSNSH